MTTGAQKGCQVVLRNKLKQMGAIVDLDETEVYIFTWRDQRSNTNRKAVYRFFEEASLSQQVNPPEWEWAVPGTGEEGSIVLATQA